MLWAISLACFASAARAVDVSFNGFATLAATYEDHDELKFRSTLIHEVRDGFTLAADSIVGGQVNVDFNEHWDAVGQLVIQDRADSTLENFIDKAFLRYKFDRNWALRVGRMDSNFFMLSDYRSVGYAYLWARPPVDFYSASSIAASVDGIDLQYAIDIWQGYLKTALFLGESEARLDGESGRLRVDFEQAIALSIEFQKGSWQFKATHAIGETNDFEYAGFDSFVALIEQVPVALWPEIPSIIDSFEPNGERASFSALGMKFDNFTWQVQGEVAHYNSDWVLFPSATFGYLSLGYYIDNWIPYVMYAGYEPKDPATRVVAPTLPAGLPPEVTSGIVTLAAVADISITDSYSDQNTISAGVRWDFADEWALKFQLDHIRLESPGTGLMGNDDPALKATPHRMNVIHLGVSTVF
ncbi:hypothetical protein [Alteromonas facilis]|uniref:hypothetical protein n=1 Tax=Alteromonas facilis TaxID=2048004 RepID=UPI000F5CC4AF|nr:hypothetical protein [Alteromonas facilis]